MVSTIHRSRRAGRWALTLALAPLGCRSPSTDPLADAATSPQAKAEPAPLELPLAQASSTTGPPLAADAGRSPEPFRGDQVVVPDVMREVGHEPGKETARDFRELAGFTLQATVRTGEGPGAPKVPEVNGAAIDAARRKTEARVAIDVASTRARFVLSGGFVLPSGTELRARADRYGHLLFWPGDTEYRIVLPGGLRALLGERRLDVAPLASADVHPSGEGTRRVGLRTHRVDVSTRAAKATLELSTIAGVAEGGTLICRWLLDLMSAPPSTPACGTDEVPLHAELRWTTRGALTFDVTGIVRRSDLAAQDLGTPPPAYTLSLTAPPPLPADTLIPRNELAAFRMAPADMPVSGRRDLLIPAPETGLLFVNATDELRVAWLDGVPAVWVAPGARLALPGMLRGRYSLQWRTFLGDNWEPADTIVAPGTSEVGSPSARP
ncbi:MAG: hypothetical protein ABSC94_13375 [Polyangiaceae bacterium]|jgi:hypothetical protein